MKLLTTPHTHTADETSAAKPYTTHTVTAKMSFPSATASAGSGGGGLFKRRQSHGGEQQSTDELASDMEYIFDGKLAVEQNALVFTLVPSPTPYARQMTSPPSSPMTRRLSLQGLFSRPAAPISPPADLDLEEDTDEQGAADGIRKLRLKRTASKGFRDFPLFVDTKPLQAIEIPVSDLGASGAEIALHKSKSGPTFFSTSPDKTANRNPASVVLSLPSGPDGYSTGTRIEFEFHSMLSDDMEAEALDYHLHEAAKRAKQSVSI